MLWESRWAPLEKQPHAFCWPPKSLNIKEFTKIGQSTFWLFLIMFWLILLFRQIPALGYPLQINTRSCLEIQERCWRDIWDQESDIRTQTFVISQPLATHSWKIRVSDSDQVGFACWVLQSNMITNKQGSGGRRQSTPSPNYVRLHNLLDFDTGVHYLYNSWHSMLKADSRII